MIRTLFLVALIVPAALAAEELSDTDVEGIVRLANGVIKGEIISITEMKKCPVNTACSEYRNNSVVVRTPEGTYMSFRASKIGGVWKLDDAEKKRLEYVRLRLQRLREARKTSE